MARTSQGGLGVNDRLFVLCTVASGNTGWEVFEKVDCTLVSKLLNLSTGPGGPLATEMLLRGEECPHVAILCFSSSGKPLLGGSDVGWRD